ncbi:hypothetical protein WN55_07987 [Dufourea novaeangliae]|nr:hypothetical protein WN55_07987 [Dufourea novaeangliae]
MTVKQEHRIFISMPYQFLLYAVISNAKNSRPFNQPFLPTSHRLQKWPDSRLNQLVCH